MAPLRSLLASFTPKSTPGLFTATITRAWMQGRTTYGGLSAALALEGAKRLLEDEELPLRSALVSFVGVAAGEVEIRAEIIRRNKTKGKGMAFVRGEVIADGSLATTAMFAFGASRTSGFDEASGVAGPSSPLPGPGECVSLFHGAGMRPNFTHNFEALLSG